MKEEERTLPQRIRAGCDPTAGTKTPRQHLCHSAFVRVATAAIRTTTIKGKLCHSAFVRVATHRPCGAHAVPYLCHSAFVRVATAAIRTTTIKGKLCHSAFVRVATFLNLSIYAITSLCHSAFVRVATAEKQCSALRICCEKVDSFSSVGESGLALTIFPFSFAAKATYVAINDSFGRAIDRFFGANRTGISVSYDFAEHPCL